MAARLAAESGPRRPARLGGERPPGIVLALMGGTPRRDTFYAPNNFGVHAHATDSEVRYLDDSVRLCATPAAEFGEGWEAELAEFTRIGRFGDWLGER